MYLIKSRQIIHVLALAVAFTLIFAIYGVNLIDEKFSDTIDAIEYLFVPQSNIYVNFNLPYRD